MKSSDEKAIDQLTIEVFEAINFEKGNPPTISKLRSLFIPNGLLIDKNPNGRIFSVEEFVSFFEAQNASGSLLSLHEIEVKSETKIFGEIAHRVSHYEARFDPKESTPFSSGVNSIQFVMIDGNWKISSMAWNEVMTKD